MSEANLVPPPPPSGEVFYPESDGKPMSDNTKQFDWILLIASNLLDMFDKRDDVFVKGNQFWYPVEGEPTIVTSPDVYVVFGRPKGHRPSYKQWEEDDIPMTVVFEIRSPANDDQEMARKFAFYDEYGVEEYYIYDPDTNVLQGYRRGEATLVRIRPIDGFVSPRLGIRFDLSGEELVVLDPNGNVFVPPNEMRRQQLQAESLARAETERADSAEQRVEEERRRVEEERRRVEEERQRVEEERRRADSAEQRAEEERQRADSAEQFAMRVRELGRKIRRQQATPEEIEEWERLTNGDDPID